MTDDGQLDIDGILDRESDVTKPPSVGGSDATAPGLAEPDANMAVEESQRAADVPGETAEAGPTAVETRPQRVFYLTNRMNLNGILSSRMIAPRESFQKYYADLLELCPGWVPLLTERPPADMIERVTAERGAGAPVVLELTDSALEGRHPDGPVTYVRAALLADVKAIHFRDKRALREHRARTYDNVHPHDDLLQVTPDLFESDVRDHMQIAAAPPNAGTDWLHTDRIRGAVNAVLAAADSGEALAAAAGVFGVEKLPNDVVIPPWLNWSTLTESDSHPASETALELADRLIFQTAYRTLGKQDQAQSWSPSGVLETVAAEIAATKPNDEAQEVIDRSLERVRQLIDVEREFEPFRNPASPYVAAKALLMTLLRPDLGQLLDWSAEETGADMTTRLAAAVLAGCLRGLARESARLRNVALDDLTAAWAMRSATGDTAGSLGTPELVADTSRTALLLDGSELQASAPLVPHPVSLYKGLDADAQLSARVAISQRMKWPIDYRVAVPADAEVQRHESSITITSSEVVAVQPRVDEQAFIDRLRPLTGDVRKRVNTLLTQAN